MRQTGFFVCQLLTLAVALVEPASAAPLYFSCAGFSESRYGKGPAMSAPDKFSLMIDLEKRRFSWTFNTRTGPVPITYRTRNFYEGKLTSWFAVTLGPLILNIIFQ